MCSSSGLSEAMLEGLETPRSVALLRLKCLGCRVVGGDGQGHEGGLPALIASLFVSVCADREPFGSAADGNDAGTSLFRGSDELKNILRVLRLVARVSRLDKTLSEELILQTEFQNACRGLRGEIEKCTQVKTTEESDLLVELQDSLFEAMGVPCCRRMPFTDEELKMRLPLVYSLSSIDSLNKAVVLVHQIHRRQSSQTDVGFVMWPSGRCNLRGRPGLTLT